PGLVRSRPCRQAWHRGADAPARPAQRGRALLRVPRQRRRLLHQRSGAASERRRRGRLLGTARRARRWCGFTGSSSMAPRNPRRKADLETNVAPDALPGELRRDDQPETVPDSMPPRGSGLEGEQPAGGGFTPAEDGGNDQHPIHDEDQEDASPSYYEREIDRIDAAIRDRSR